MNNQKKCSVNQNNFMIRSSNKLKLLPEKDNGDQEGKEENGAKPSPAREVAVPASKYLSPIEFNQAALEM